MKSGRSSLFAFLVGCSAEAPVTSPSSTGDTSSGTTTTSDEQTQTSASIPETDSVSSTAADTSTTEPAAESSGSSSTSTGVESTGSTGEPQGHVLYLNLDGAVLEAGSDDATTNSVWDESLAGEHGAIEHAGLRDFLFAEMQARWSGLPITVSLTRPSHDDYSMLVVSGSDGPPGVGGIARISDCADVLPNSVGIVWPGAFFGGSAPLPDEQIDFSDVQTLANAASAIGGFLYGLELVENGAGEGDIMWETAFMSPLDRVFEDACLPILSAAPVCPATHEQHCPPGEQNSFAELSATLQR